MGSTTQHLEPMSRPNCWIGHKPELSADCLNAWVAYGNTPYCVTTHVSTAVISDQLESRLATSIQAGKPYYQMICMDRNQHSQIDKSVKMHRASRIVTNSQHEAMKVQCRDLSTSYCISAAD